MYGYIKEIFPSIQGEGLYVGVPQLFIRFAGCALHCFYCDTTNAQRRTEKNKFTVTELLTKIQKYLLKQYHSISLTGGEPLEQIEFLEFFLPALNKIKVPIYLETNGILPENFHRVAKFIDIVSLDLKLPSSCAGREYWEIHRKFLGYTKPQNVFVKVVITTKTTEKEIYRLHIFLNSLLRPIPVILQPVTLPNGSSIKIVLNRTLNWYYYLKVRLNQNWDLRVIPQLHRIWGIR